MSAVESLLCPGCDRPHEYEHALGCPYDPQSPQEVRYGEGWHAAKVYYRRLLDYESPRAVENRAFREQ